MILSIQFRFSLIVCALVAITFQAGFAQESQPRSSVLDLVPEATSQAAPQLDRATSRDARPPVGLERHPLALPTVTHRYVGEIAGPNGCEAGCLACQTDSPCGCDDCRPRASTVLGRSAKLMSDRCGRSKSCDRRALGFVVEEVQYGANAGPPSYGYVSHAAWYTGEKFNLRQRLFRRQSGKQLFGRRAVGEQNLSDDLNVDGYHCGYFSAAEFDSHGQGIPTFPTDSFSYGLEMIPPPNQPSDYPSLPAPNSPLQPQSDILPSPAD